MPILLLRILRPIASATKDNRVRCHIKRTLNLLRMKIDKTDRDDGICWNRLISTSMSTHVRYDLYKLFKTFIQGPVLQFVLKSDIPLIQTLSPICCEGTLHDLMNILNHPDSIGSQHSSLLSLNTLRAGFASIAELERDTNVSFPRKSIGSIFKECALLVDRFHALYDRKSRPESAFLYRNRWSSTNAHTLRMLMSQRYPDISHESGNLYTFAMKTGSYFPGRPQVRPLPFNDEEASEADFERAAQCSKDFLQCQTSFTPGALTFCCSCSHTKVLGFKVLHRNEGPRAIMDTVISRFGHPPKYLIYDFCCGLFLAAIHRLWWALANVYVVCDGFHIRNHSCSPTYSPNAHKALRTVNTVAHEQRNRAICKLGISLRNCSQHLYTSLLAYQTIVLNIRAQAKGTTTFQRRPQKYSDFDIEWCSFQCLRLPCSCCFS